ncbi:MAG: hypothetical protein JWN99_2221 [Ilumatobacteraceae bacterium]|nr:hypothetical protein [Ilumatobacteraceae bacterium]
MKKVYVLVAAIAAFGALSVGSTSFAADHRSVDSVPATDDTVPATDDTVPATDSVPTTAPSTTAAPTTSPVTTDSPTTTAAAVLPTTLDTTTTSSVAPAGITESSALVGQEAPTTTTKKVGSDGLLPNTGGDVAIPLILALLAAGTGAATLLVRRRSNVS